MRLLPSLLGLLGLFAPAYAMVYNLSAPSTVPNGGNLTATLYTADYIQNWVDFGVIWGLLRPEINCTGCIGAQLGYDNLYNNPAVPTIDGNATFSIHVPNGTTPGGYYLIAAVPHLVGVSGVTSVSYFASNITVT